MKTIFKALAIFSGLTVCLFHAPAMAQSAPVLGAVVTSCNAQTYSSGSNRPLTQDTAGNLCSNSAGSSGETVTANQGTPNAGGATNSWPVQGAGVAGTPAGGVVSVQGVAGGTAAPISAATLPLPTGASTSANQSAGTNAAPSAVVESVQGGVASGAADSGNPVKVGCVFLNARPGPSSGNRQDSQCDNQGDQYVINPATSLSSADAIANTAAKPACATAAGVIGICYASTVPFVFNGSTWDRQFTCTSQATISVTAGSTTQIVALSGTTVIRVCNFTVSLSLAGTVSVLTGTGTNCGTPTTVIPAMSLATGTPMSIQGPSGGSAFRGSAGGEICVTAATGNAVGYLTYAQY